jgi:hypothetical protein
MNAPEPLARIAAALERGADALARIADSLTASAPRVSDGADRAPDVRATSPAKRPRRPARDACEACGVIFDTQGFRTHCADCFTALRRQRARSGANPPRRDQVPPPGADSDAPHAAPPRG